MAYIPWFFVLLPFLPALNVAYGLDLALIRALVPIAGLWVFIVGIKKRKFFIPTALPFLAWSAFTILAGSSLFWANDTAFALRKAVFFFSLLPIGFVIVNMSEIIRRRILFMIVLGSVVSALIALFFFFAQFLFGAESVANILFGGTADVLFGFSAADAIRTFPSWYIDIGYGEAFLRATFPFPNPHTAALFWGMGLGLACGLRPVSNSSKSAVRRYWPLAIRYVLLTALLATFSRGAYISLLALLIAYGIWHIAKSREMATRHRLFAVSCSVLAAVMFTLVVPSVPERFLSTWDIGEGSNSARIALWHDAKNIFFSSPILGAGLGNFASTLAPGSAYRDPTNAHSTYLEIAAELGLIGIFFFLCAVFGGIVFSARSHRPEIALALIFFAVHAIFETDLYYPANHIIFLTLLTLAGLQAELSRNKKQGTSNNQFPNPNIQMF